MPCVLCLVMLSVSEILSQRWLAVPCEREMLGLGEDAGWTTHCAGGGLQVDTREARQPSPPEGALRARGCTHSLQPLARSA